jgi:hypothetical protein
MRLEDNMRIEPEYDDYFVFSAVYHKGKQSSCGACPVVWEDQSALQGTQNKRLLTFADGNYHLYDDEWFMEEDTDVVEETIFSALNEAGETFGRINLKNTDCEVCWCLLEREQAIIVMDIPNWTVPN